MAAGLAETSVDQVAYVPPESGLLPLRGSVRERTDVRLRRRDGRRRQFPVQQPLVRLGGGPQSPGDGVARPLALMSVARHNAGRATRAGRRAKVSPCQTRAMNDGLPRKMTFQNGVDVRLGWSGQRCYLVGRTSRQKENGVPLDKLSNVVSALEARTDK